MKTFNLAVSRKKRNNHIVNIVILTALYFMGFWLGKHYVERYSPYTVAYTIPSLVVGLVVCKRFSDKVRAYLHPHTKSRVTVYNYGNDYDPSMGVVGILFKYAFYTFIGFFIFPVQQTTDKHKKSNGCPSKGSHLVDIESCVYFTATFIVFMPLAVATLMM